jgi:hypothetical protein
MASNFTSTEDLSIKGETVREETVAVPEDVEKQRGTVVRTK